ncbi:hypothetical protein KUTeg_000188 [Tegillarca granosa]|uniref:Aldehyde dehydrogenase domain-containing protein n=1 Tax=Tegillarca granosa TaxID=220873 RepID=A0ABQ9G0A0_TEGGR|nr:hypothetical protein KUTeg_000188 [Tegillarca granosa]
MAEIVVENFINVHAHPTSIVMTPQLERFGRKFRTAVKRRSTRRSDRLLLHSHDILESRLTEFAELESRDQGKPLWLARSVDIPRAVYNFRYFATYILHDLNRSSILEAANAVNYTVKQPVGVAGLISPWNLPLYLLTFKLAPAIAAGNTVVAKPSEMTSVTAYKLCGILNEAGLPAGVINMVFGVGPKAGEVIVKHPDVPLISFTGGTATAKKLRFYEPGRDLSMYKSKLVVGDPKDEKTFVGALISKEHLQKVKGYVDRAEPEGATIACGKEELNLPDKNKKGYFMRPTVITNVKDNSPLMKEEIFGPVTCVVPFDTEEEAGTVWANCWLVRDLNMPFGGVKNSGIGREGGKDSLEFYTEEKTICVKL